MFTKESISPNYVEIAIVQLGTWVGSAAEMSDLWLCSWVISCVSPELSPAGLCAQGALREFPFSCIGHVVVIWRNCYGPHY